MPTDGAHRPVHRWQRAENLLIALAIPLAVAAWGGPWWVLLVAFLAFDLSALGYLVDQRRGAFWYNLVHNFAPPAALVGLWAGLQLVGVEAGWLVLLAASWGFHVAVDRALGFGLKIRDFHSTHLGAIGHRTHPGPHAHPAPPAQPVAESAPVARAAR